jgi:hypothetical protein
MPATAAIDNETLDHLLSVVADTVFLGIHGALLKTAPKSP